MKIKPALAMRLLTIFGVVFLTQCQEKTSSEILHQFGKTTANIEKFRACPEPKKLAGYEVTIEYLQKLKNYIAQKNPATFKGQLAPENICVNLELKDEGISGGAFAGDGAIFIERILIKQSQSDASLAGTICHELAHIALNHQSVQKSPGGKKIFNFKYGVEPERYFPMIVNNPRYVKAKRQLDSIFERLHSDENLTKELQAANDKLITSIFSAAELAEASKNVSVANRILNTLKTCDAKACNEFRANFDKIDRLGNQIAVQRHEKIVAAEFEVYQAAEAILPKDVLITWMEREADEVGLEFCARAGFDHDALNHWFIDRLKQFDPEPDLNDFARCRKKIDETMANLGETKTDPFLRIVDIPLLVESSQDRHPQDCWRLFNMERELKFHGADYNPFEKRIVDALPNGLLAAQEEIRRMQKN